MTSVDVHTDVYRDCFGARFELVMSRFLRVPLRSPRFFLGGFRFAGVRINRRANTEDFAEAGEEIQI
ncbi:MAG TPA: hypothetical protein DC054_23110 [Blastocatellia bacterium]|nr:hypothetical protein [Blastocatellia bacterium]